MDSHTSFDIKPRSVTLTQVIPYDVDVVTLGENYNASYSIDEFLGFFLSPVEHLADIPYKGERVDGVIYKNAFYSPSDVYFTFATEDEDFTQTLTVKELTDMRTPYGFNITQLISVSILAEVEEY